MEETLMVEGEQSVFSPCVEDDLLNANNNATNYDFEKKRKIVVLTLTENCNLDCAYCFEKNKSKQFMDIQIAKKVIEYEFTHSDEFDEIEFDLFGGEPTLRKSLIKKLVGWTYAQTFEKPYLFFLETNGTLMDSSFKKWLKDNKEYVVAGVSIDGTPETHNKNRSDSYDQIDIGFFLSTYPDQSVRMTIYNETIGNLSKDIIHLHQLGFREVAATFAHGIDWDIEQHRGDLVEQLENLCEYYLNHPEIKECSIFDMNLPDILSAGKKVRKWCGTGTSMVSYGVDGKKYPCHTFQSNTTGPSKTISQANIDFSKITDFSDPECVSCILEPICPNCYGMNYVESGDILKRDKGVCEIVKMRALATSYLKARRIERGEQQIMAGELFRTIQAIKKIQQLVQV
jgi:uncharacterized protein